MLVAFASRFRFSPAGRGLWFALAASVWSAATVAKPPCQQELVPYAPRAVSSVKVQLPAVPANVVGAIRIGDAYSVWGASYSLRSRAHRAELQKKSIAIEGYIVKTNLLDAPRCALRPASQAQACRAPVPTFWVGDTPDAAPEASIKVMGWASSFAEIYAVIRDIDSGRSPPANSRWDTALPNPLPAVGAKVRVTGSYGQVLVKMGMDPEVDLHMGVLGYFNMRYLEPARELATLPGVRRAKRPE